MAGPLTMSIQAKKSLGQHFLTDQSVCRRIADFADIRPGEAVVEIGPGTGSLTRVLLDRGARVTAIEIDRRLADALRTDPASSDGGLTVVEADILGFDWSAIVGQQPVKVVGNLPYNIGTRILQEMIGPRHRFQDIVVMLQKEVAQRILARPGETEYGYLTLLLGNSFLVRKGFDVPPGAFRPMPKVVSSVIGLRARKDPSDADGTARLPELLSAAFRHRRKTLANNLRAAWDRDDVARALRECSIPASARPQQVTLREFRCLARLL